MTERGRENIKRERKVKNYLTREFYERLERERERERDKEKDRKINEK